MFDFIPLALVAAEFIKNNVAGLLTASALVALTVFAMFAVSRFGTMTIFDRLQSLINTASIMVFGSFGLLWWFFGDQLVGVVLGTIAVVFVIPFVIYLIWKAAPEMRKEFRQAFPCWRRR